jgi:hypothetical protein
MGTNFDVAGLSVTVGGAPATNVTVVNATTVTCDTPAGTPDTAAAVKVTTDGGSATGAGFSYYPIPTVTAVSPDLIVSEGGQSITITGTGFTVNSAGTNEVRIGGTLATNVTTTDDTTITCDAPAGTAGTPGVVVTNANGSGTLAGGLAYQDRGILYLSQDDNGSGLFVVDTTTGAATLSGSGTSGVTANTVGLAPGTSPGELYGSTWRDIVVTAADGSGTTPFSDEEAVGLALHEPRGLLYVAFHTTDFKSVDLATGAVITPLSHPGIDLMGITADVENDKVYGIGGSTNLWVYDIPTDTWSDLGDLGAGTWGRGSGLAYDPARRVIYAIGADDTDLYEIDPVAVTATSIGALGTPANGGLAVVPKTT